MPKAANTVAVAAGAGVDATATAKANHPAAMSTGPTAKASIATTIMATIRITVMTAAADTAAAIAPPVKSCQPAQLRAQFKGVRIVRAPF